VPVLLFCLMYNLLIYYSQARAINEINLTVYLILIISDKMGICKVLFSLSYQIWI
jgi:hypothetical protein